MLLLSALLDLTETSLLEQACGEPICKNLELNPTSREVATDLGKSEGLSNDRTPLKATDEAFGRLVCKSETEGKPLGKKNLEHL